MKAKLRNIHSPDIFDLQGFVPKEENDFGLLLQLIVSALDSDGEESFDIMLCTPKWLTRNHKKTDIIFGRHYLIVFEYNYRKIYDKLKVSVESIEVETWDEIGLKIGRIGKWEFEDYHP